MFEAVRKNKRISQIILAIIIVPFAFFGVDAYFRGGPSGGDVASIGKTKISAAQLERALRDQQNRLRVSLGDNYDRTLFDTETFRRSVLNDLITQRLLGMQTADMRLSIGPSQLQDQIAQVSSFHDNGQFSLQRYEALLRNQNMTPASFEASLAQDLRQQQILDVIIGAGFASKETARRLLQAQLEKRQIREIRFEPKDFMNKAKLAENAVQQYYEQHPARFEEPQRVRVEYVVLDEASQSERIEVAEEAIQAFYQGNSTRFVQGETRRARHILLEVGEGADEDSIAKVHQKAEEILKLLRETPERFEEIARSESQDLGSASSGGDLGFFGVDEMVAPFSEAAFSLDKEQISEIVRTDFGFHIIQVVDIRPAMTQPLEAVRNEIQQELRSSEATRQFALAAEQFANTVYEQPDSLEPVVSLFGLSLQTSDWINAGSDRLGPYQSEKLVQALFSENVLKARENSEVIEVSRGVLVSARVLEHENAKIRTLEEVHDSIEKLLHDQEAARIASEQGEVTLAALLEGKEIEQKWGEPRQITRTDADLAASTQQAIFAPTPAKLPTFVGASIPGGGYGLYHIENVEIPAADSFDDEQLAAIQGQYTFLATEYDLAAYVDNLKQRFKVEINESSLRNNSQEP